MSKTTGSKKDNKFRLTPEQKVLCCVWGTVNEQSDETLEYICDDDTMAEPPKEFVAYGSAAAVLKIAYISVGADCFSAYERNHKLPSMGVHKLAISPDSSKLGAVSMDGTLMLLHVNDGIKQYNLTHNLSVSFWSAVFGVNSEFVYGGSSAGFIYQYSTATGKLCNSYNSQHGESVLGVDISADGKLIACCDHGGYLTVLDAVTGQIVQRKNLKHTLRSLCFDPGMKYLLVACDDTTVKVLDLTSGHMRENALAHESLVMAVDVAPNGEHFVSGSCNGTVKLWDTRNMKCNRTFHCQHNANLWDVAFNCTSNKVACVGDGRGLHVINC